VRRFYPIKKEKLGLGLSKKIKPTLIFI